MGSDFGDCTNETAPCLTISYAYNCFLGNNGCGAKGYDGNGIINLGDGDWYWPSDHALIYDNEQVIINGNGMDNTSLYYDDATGIGCKWHKCWLELNNLALLANKSSNTPNNKNMQIYVHDGGALILRSVLFDGINYDSNIAWNINGDRVNVKFNSCTFQNYINGKYEISNGANVEITHSLFTNNMLNMTLYQILNSSLKIVNTTFTGNLGVISSSLFEIHNSTLDISESTFIENADVSSLIAAYDSSCRISHSIFNNNLANNLIHITNSVQSAAFNCPSESSMANVVSSLFENNQVTSILFADQTTLFLNGNIFTENVCSDFCLNAEATSAFFDLRNHAFFNGTHTNNNLLYFDSVDVPQSLCINAFNITQAIKYLSFHNDTDTSNTRVIFNDGIQPFSFNYVIESPQNVTNWEQSYTNSIAGGAVLQTFECYDNISTCAIECIGSAACNSATFEINSPTTSITCNDEFACQSTDIKTSTNTLQSLHVLCDATSACFGTNIHIISIDEVAIDCVAAESCLQMEINILRTGFGEINCYAQDACKFLTINTESDNVLLTMFQNSDCGTSTESKYNRLLFV